MASLSEALRDWILQPVIVKLTHMEERLMSGMADIDTAIQAENPTIQNIADALAALATVAAKIAADVAALKAKVGTGADTTNEVTAIASQTSKLATAAQQMADVAATLTAADTSANA